MVAASATTASIPAFPFTCPDPVQRDDGLSLLSLSSRLAGIVSGHITNTWNAISGKRYRLQYKNDLANPQWFDLPGDITAIGSSASKLDDTIMGLRQRFYRVILLP